jgi:hypothetical protein
MDDEFARAYFWNSIAKLLEDNFDSLIAALVPWYAGGSLDLQIKLDVLTSCKFGPTLD